MMEPVDKMSSQKKKPLKYSLLRAEDINISKVNIPKQNECK